MSINSIKRIIKPLGIWFLLLASFGLQAAETQVHELDRLVVTASEQPLHEVVQPIKVLDQEALQQASGSTLGEMLESLPGISNASFGSGVGRPVIRGMAGNRVKVAVNGNDAADVSAMSNDHAPMAEAANAEQVEIIYGPGTLLFGSGAIGGVINMVDARIHNTPLLDDDGQTISKGQVNQSVSSVNSGFETSASLDAGFAKNWVVHLDGFKRESENYDSPQGEVLNTQTQAKGFSSGISHIRENGHSALAVSVLDYEYGVPNEGSEPAGVTPYQVRIDGEHEHGINGKLLESYKLQFSINNYQHDETDDGEVVGYFEKDNVELKTIFTLNHDWIAQSKVGIHLNRQALALCHDHNGCEGVPNYSHLNWDGSQGANLNDELVDGKIIYFAHDTPMPETTTLDVAGFWIFSGDWAHGKKEFAIRADQKTIQLDPVSIRPASRQAASYYEDYDFFALTGSAGWTWLTDNQKYGLSIARTERAPQADEMFWNGDHHATFSYQLDNPNLELETAYTADVTWQYFTQDYQLDAAVYYYDFDGYIFNELQSVVDPIHGNAVYQFVQEDAYLTGFELAGQYHVSQLLVVTGSIDKVSGCLKAGANKNLPRTPPMSALLGLTWQQDAWLLKANVRFYAQQDQVGNNEQATAAYETLNAFVGYEIGFNDVALDIHLKANNLTEIGRAHV